MKMEWINALVLEKSCRLKQGRISCEIVIILNNIVQTATTCRSALKQMYI